MGGFLSSMLDVTKRVDIYNPSTDHWRLGPELPGAETHMGVVSVSDGFVLVGGFQGNVLDRITTAGVWRFQTANAAWKSEPDLPTPRAAVFAALVDGTVHAAGGLAADGNTDAARAPGVGCRRFRHCLERCGAASEPAQPWGRRGDAWLILRGLRASRLGRGRG